MGDSVKDSTSSGENVSQPDPTEPPARLRSDTSSTKASKKSTGSTSSGGQVDGYPSQISYNANMAPNGHGHHIRMQHPPSMPSVPPGSNVPYQLNDPVTGVYPPPHMHAYQMPSSPVILTTNQAHVGIAFSPTGGNYPTNQAHVGIAYSPTRGNYPMQMMNPSVGGGLPPTPPSMQYQPQDMNSSNHNARNRSNMRSPHRRSSSYNGTTASSVYGSMDASATQSFFSHAGGGAPPLPRRRNSKTGATGTGGRKRTNSADFSPVSEIRKLTGGGGNGMRQPISPNPQLTRAHNRAKSEDWQGRISPQIFPPPISTNTNPLYQQQQAQSMAYNRGVYMGGDVVDDISPFSGSIHTINGGGMTGSIRSIKDRTNSEDDGSDAGGEAVFLLNKSTRKQSSRGKSRAKKKHIRQRSAQLFMEEVKGAEQIPRCRDIVFLLLFVFHLLGIIYLGRTYGNEALRFHDESPEDSESSVTIIFRNLIYIAGLSGVFAMVVSGLTLLLMTSIADKIVQIALILSITFSFVWGTMGIGLSPKKIIPIIGIVALTMSVAYAFMVWDRIPFAAANLHTALSGILANPGAVFVTFVFQVLALGWSIYYIFVGGGVYDAIQVGDIDESFEGIEYVYYVLLGISYYWTLNVFLVSSQGLRFN
jgi:hypothetical protein